MRQTASLSACIMLAVLMIVGADSAVAQSSQNKCASGPYKDVSIVDDRIAACTIQIDANPPPAKLALSLSLRAQNLFEKSQCEPAFADLNRALVIVPKGEAAINNDLRIWSSYYWQNCKGDFDRGIAVITEAIAMLPRDPSGYNQRSNLLRDKGDYAGAIADINKSLTLINNDPYRASAYNNRALIWKMMGEYDKSIADFSVAINLTPKNPKYYANRGDAYRLSGNLDRALQEQNRSVEMYAGGPGVWLGLAIRGDTLRYMGEYDRALADYNEALRNEPGFAPAYTGRGLTRERTGDYAKAKADFQMALSKSENSGRGDISKQARETAEARLAALASGAPQPQFQPTPGKATSNTSIPTQIVAAPVVASAIVKATAAKQGRRVALVIGNSAYVSIAPLANPHNDADKVAEALRAIGFDTVTLASDSPRAKMLDTLRTFTDAASKSDWAMVYYAGHGMEISGVNYLIPIDAKIALDRDIGLEAVPLDKVMTALDGAKKLKLVMLDACRDNPFAEALAKAAAATPAASAQVASADSSRGVKTRSVGRGLGEVKVQGASLVVYAAKHGQTALDGDGGNSPFAVAVVQRLATPGVEINKLFRLVRDDVMEATAGRQEPYTYGSLPGEDFFFVAK